MKKNNLNSAVRIFVTCLFFSTTLVLAQPPDDPISPATMQQLIGRGFDVTWKDGNRKKFDSKKVKDIAAAEFANVRIRTSRPTTNDFFNFTDKIVNDCLANGIIPIIAYTGPESKSNPDSIQKQKTIDWWTAVAEHYKNYSHKLLFDLFVEIPALSDLSKVDGLLNEWYAAIIPAIRDSNPTRILFMSPIHRSEPTYLDRMVIPDTTDKYIMAQTHFYAGGPSKKTGNRKEWTTGTPAEKKKITDLIDYIVAWQHKNNRYAWIGAWMAGNYNAGNDYTVDEQIMFANFVITELAKIGIPWSINAFHHFYDESVLSWKPDMIPLRDALVSKVSASKHDFNY